MSFPNAQASVQVDAPVERVAPHSRAWLVVVAVTILAAALRLYKLGEWSFWVDEMFTLEDVFGTGKLGLYHGMTYPLSYILIGLSVNTFGLSEWTARIVPALFGIATPAMVYLLARRRFGEGPSIMAAGIIAISPWSLYWSQMARFYTMTLFFSSASILVLYKGLEENKKSYAAAAGILMALGTISHYSALLMLVAVGVYVAVVPLLRWRRPAGLNLKNSIIFLAPFILGAVLVGAKAGALLSKYAAGHPTGTNIANPITAAAYVIASLAYRVEPTMAVLAVAGAWIGLRRRDRGALFLTAAVVVPALILIVAGVMSHAENRYAFVVLPPVALLAGSALSVIFRSLRETNRTIAIAAVLAVAFPLLQHDASYFGPVSNGERWNYRAAADFLRSRAQPGDVVYSAMPLSLEHYLRDADLVVLDLNIGPDSKDLPQERAWFVIEDETRGESMSRRISGWLRSEADLAANFPASSPAANYGLSVYLVDGH